MLKSDNPVNILTLQKDISDAKKKSFEKKSSSPRKISIVRQVEILTDCNKKDTSELMAGCSLCLLQFDFGAHQRINFPAIMI